MPKGVYTHKKGHKFSKEQYLSRSGNKHHGWKGKDVGYFGIHVWVKKHFGSANHCERCGTKDIPVGKECWFEWSRKTKKLSRDINDWWQLCIPCHRGYDGWHKKIAKKRADSKWWLTNPNPRDIHGRFITK